MEEKDIKTQKLGVQFESVPDVVCPVSLRCALYNKTIINQIIINKILMKEKSGREKGTKNEAFS